MKIVEKHPQIKKYTSLAKFMIICGLVIITVLGIPPLVSALSMYVDNQCFSKYECVTLEYTFSYLLKNEEVFAIEGNLGFRSEHIFAVNNKIDYKFELISTLPNVVKSMDFILIEKNEDISKYQNKTIDEIRSIAKQDSRLIDMIIEGNKIHRDGIWSSPKQTEYYLIGYLTDYNNNLLTTEKSDPIADLKSWGEFKQIKGVYLTDFTNFTLLGLSWVGVGAIPLVIGVEIFLRLNLRENQVDKWNMDRSSFD